METDKHPASLSGRYRSGRVRPLRKDDGRSVALLIAEYSAEIGAKPPMTVEQTEQLFATPWLEGGVGFIMEHGSGAAGYGFVRPTRWLGTDSIQFGLTLKHGFRDLRTCQILTDPLLAAAADLARKRSISGISAHLRSTDTVHPPLLLELGFQEHPISMLGFRHDLADVPVRALPEGLSLRPARLPDEKEAVLHLIESAFDDRDRQGEPISDTYVDFIAGKSGFDLEQVLLVENSGAPVGVAIVDATAHSAGSNYTILQLCVLPVWRRRGIGSALVCRILAGLKSRRAGAALAGMFSNNPGATLYWRLGFRPDPQRTYRFFVRDAITRQEDN